MENGEYYRFDTNDRKVLRWLVAHAPESVSSWVEMQAEHYRLAAGIRIDREKLLAEIAAGLPDMGKPFENR